MQMQIMIIMMETKRLKNGLLRIKMIINLDLKQQQQTTNNNENLKRTQNCLAPPGFAAAIERLPKRLHNRNCKRLTPNNHLFKRSISRKVSRVNSYIYSFCI